MPTDAPFFPALITTAPPLPEDSAAGQFLDDLKAACEAREDLPVLRAALAAAGPLHDLVLSIMDASPYLRQIMLRHPEDLEAMAAAAPDRLFADIQQRLDDELLAETPFNEAMTLLRAFKRRAALGIALFDIGGCWELDRTLAAITQAADKAVAAAVDYLFDRARLEGKLPPLDAMEKNPVRAPGYFVLAMGKQGGGDLNYSSDIDLIVFYDLTRIKLPDGAESQSFFVRLTRNLVKLLNERTVDGYVYRTDLRLRPDPGATQVAISTDAALSYYESYGQNWERAAMIKARPVAGDIEAGDMFLRELSPFIWRKYLDFAAIHDIHAMKRQIHAFKGHAEIAVAGHNIKLGRGGIREIEFFIQTQQLIAGGRQPELRGRKTLQNLQLLKEHDWISPLAAKEMTAAYCFLRHVEHRIQMVNDEQTQTLPDSVEGVAAIGRFCGFADPEEFRSTLTSQLQKVQKHYGALFEDAPALGGGGALSFTGDAPDPDTIQTLSRMGFERPEHVFSCVKEWHHGRAPATRSTRAKEALTELAPALLEAVGKTASPDSAFTALDKFVRGLPAGVQLFALLQNNPELLDLLALILGSAPRLAATLAQRPKLLDAVIDPGFFGALPDEEELDQAMRDAIALARDYDQKLDMARIAGREQAFLIGVRVLSDTITAAQAGAAYASLAGSAISELLRAAETELQQRHGGFSAGGAAVLAMGKLGGQEMTAGSDLDLIVVFDHPDNEPESNGARPLAGAAYFSRLTQRLISALSAPTPEGFLYETDMRLRPSGKAGPVATSLRSFTNYQNEEAWSWEHMALTRARIVAGPTELRDRLNGVIQDALRKPRDGQKLAREVTEMRERIWKEKGANDVWSLKQVRGGLVDLEFTAQYLQLVNAHAHPEALDQNTGLALRKLAQAGLLDWADAEQLIETGWMLHTLTQILRLCHDGPFDPAKAPEGLRKLLTRSVERPDFRHLEIDLADSQRRCHQLFDKLVAAQA